jgi:Undecaprenyl-phosphate galactose phosphotransferase WbaP
MSTAQSSSIAQLTALSEAPDLSALLKSRSARPWLCVANLLFSDLLALSFSAAVGILVWRHFGRPFDPDFYWKLWPVLLLFPVAYAVSGLYPGFGRNPADELRKLSVATSVVYPALAVTIFLLKDSATYSRGIFALAWMQTLVIVPFFRSLLRSACASGSWWGYPVVIVGAGRAAQLVARTLEKQPALGLRPIAILATPQLAMPLARKAGVRHAMLVLEDIPHRTALDFFERCAELFPHVTMVPDLAGFSSLWVEARDMNGVLGLAVHQRLLLPSARIIKRAMDLCFVIVGSAVLLPLAAIIAAVVKISSPGPVLYGSPRYGRGGRPFTAWKFRSMVVNANEVFANCLAHDAALQAEWQQTQKLRHDPRVTWVGRFLRRTSLDELPQFWNVLLGQMSLIGPRPVLAQEVLRYGDGYALYQKVTPGLSGLWQVSGRNRMSYEEHVALDLYYVRNWSIWLDIHILARTLRAVVLGDGAY